MGEAGETPWPRGAHTGGAWLSSARVVRCSVKSGNERNPRRVLPSSGWALARDCRRQAGGRWGRRQVIMPLTPWAAHVLQWPAQRVATPRGGADPQSRPQFGSEAATRLREAGVASNRGSARRGEYVPGSCTHRPSHHPSRLHPKPPAEPARGGGVEGVEGEGGEVVTR